MKWIFATVAVLMLAGCGSNFEWFPDSETDPKISSFAPTEALPGAQVIINGTNFSTTPANNLVKFNGTAAVVTSATASQIVTVVPTGATTGPITVTIGSKTSTSATNFTVSETVPTIASFSPLHGISGAVVTINGTGFSSTPASNLVKFNGTTAVVTSATALQIVATVPTGASTGPITVTVGSKIATSATNFTVPPTVLLGGAVQGNELTLANTVTTFAGITGESGSANDTGTAASFNSPIGITTDGTNLYVADANNNTIRKITIATGVVSTLAGTAGTSGFADGTGAAASFNFPVDITTDGTNLYVTDAFNNTIRKIVIATGAVSTIAGTAGNFGSDDGTGAAASFDFPSDITTDGTNLYVTDASNNTIRKIVIATKEVSTLAGTAGTSGFADGTGAAASFDLPNGITMDKTNLYVTEANNNTIRKVVIATGAVSTLAGTAGIPGSADGFGAAASFNVPSDITTDGSNLYVTDTDNSTIRKIVIDTKEVSTIAGTVGNFDSADGTGAAASFNAPEGITTDGINLYLSDTDNNTIRKIQ